MAAPAGAPRRYPILLQVNVDADPAKSGLHPPADEPALVQSGDWPPSMARLPHARKWQSRTLPLERLFQLTAAGLSEQFPPRRKGRGGDNPFLK